MGSEFDEELVHLTKVSGIAMGIKKRKPSKRVFPERGDDLIPGLGFEQMNLHVPIGGDAGEDEPAVILSANVVGGRVRREEGKLGSHAAGYISH